MVPVWATVVSLYFFFYCFHFHLIFVSETYSLTDGIYYHANEETLIANVSTDASTTFDNDMSLTLPNKFELTFKLKNQSITAGARFGLIPTIRKGTNSPTYSVYGQQTTTKYVGVYRDTSTHAVGSDTACTGTDYNDWKITRDGNTFKWYFNGTQINSDVTLSWWDNYVPHCLCWQYWRSGTAYVKEILIKPL